MKSPGLISTELWRRIGEGDAHAMKTLYQESYQHLYVYGFRMLADQDKVKDCLQELFCELWINRNQNTQVLNVIAYLKICVRNKLLKVIAADKNTILLDADLENPDLMTHSYEQLLIESQHSLLQKQRLHHALDSLTNSQREIIRMKFFEELSYQEISLLLDITLRTVYNHLHAALVILRGNFKR